METPKHYEFMNPTLQALRAGGETLTNEEIVGAVVTLMQLPDEVLDRQQHGHHLGEVKPAHRKVRPIEYGDRQALARDSALPKG